MKTTDFDKFNAPVNTLARIVTSEKKPEYEYETKAPKHWKTPPDTLPYPVERASEMIQPGERFGRFTVIGYLGKERANRSRAAYLVRCTCGDYESRTSYELRSNKPRIQHAKACFNCLRWQSLLPAKK